MRKTRQKVPVGSSVYSIHVQIKKAIWSKYCIWCSDIQELPLDVHSASSVAAFRKKLKIILVLQGLATIVYYSASVSDVTTTAALMDWCILQYCSLRLRVYLAAEIKHYKNPVKNSDWNSQRTLTIVRVILCWKELLLSMQFHQMRLGS